MTAPTAEKPTAEEQDTMELTPDEIRQVLEALDASTWDEAVITVGDVRIAVARNGAALPGTDTAPPPPTRPTDTPAPATTPETAPAVAPTPAPSVPADPATAATPGTSDRALLVAAPSVGVFWRSPEPSAPPFVDVGRRVAKGDTMGIVEVMKLMSHVYAPASGTVTGIHVENAASVEHGAPLFTLQLDEG
ncbi:acetyl-CoA carboxylase biotin carboxyl carrier protein [Streptomyces sp. NPDC058001]|uniref:acetyl-CoA carboxylase biotin carboxyl carrier protein n=1 Tax=Streptomyces sp. NPDC058001 TaxID=3346300 RepID=UPI0036EFB97B